MRHRGQFTQESRNILVPAIPNRFFCFEKPFDERKRRKL